LCAAPTPIHDYGDSGNTTSSSPEFGDNGEGFAQADRVYEDLFFTKATRTCPGAACRRRQLDPTAS
jgi:hypothetical protein